MLWMLVTAGLAKQYQFQIWLHSRMAEVQVCSEVQSMPVGAPALARKQYCEGLVGYSTRYQ